MSKKTANQENYILYEHFCMDYQRNNFKHITWHWSQIPITILYESGFIHDYNKVRLEWKKKFNETGVYQNPFREYGIDGISEEIINNEKVYHAIQCKLWATTLCANDLGTFMTALYWRMKIKNNKSTGYLYHSGPLQIDLRDDMKNANSQITPIKLEYNSTSETNIVINNEIMHNPYQFQIDIIKKLNDGWNGRSLLVSPCGTGKTFIIGKHLQNIKYKNIFIFSPLRLQVNQILNRISKFIPTYAALKVDCDEDGTRNIEDIINLLHKQSIIVSTYKSAEDVISKLFTKTSFSSFNSDEYIDENEDDNENDNDNEDDIKNTTEDDENYEFVSNFDLSDSLLIVDEAHNLINNIELIDLIKAFPKTLLLTATPPSKIEEIIDCNIIYNYPMRQAIKDGFICDYDIYLPLIENDDEQNLFFSFKNSFELNNELYIKSLFLINGLLRTGSRRCIVYLTSVKECNDFVNVFKNVMKDYYSLPLWINIISYFTIQSKRDDILKIFQDEMNENLDMIKIIASVKILDEGIDIIKCDSTFIANVNDGTSDIRTLQRLCRANRKDLKNPNKKAVCFMWATDLNKCVNSLSILKENDIDFNSKISYMTTNFDKNNNIETIKLVRKMNTDLLEYINIKCLSKHELWEFRKNQLFNICNDIKQCPIQRSFYGRWLSSQKMKIKSIHDPIYITLSENLYVKENLDIFLKNHLTKCIYSHEEKIVLLFEFSNKHSKTPPRKIPLGHWLIRQFEKIYNGDEELKKQLSVNKYVQKRIEKYFIFKKRENLSFSEQFDEINKYCNKYNKISPNHTRWISYQKTLIKSTDDELYKTLSSNLFVKKRIDIYLNRDKNINISDKRKDQLFNYFDTHNKPPLTKSLLGKWFGLQLRNITNADDDKYIWLCTNLYVKKHIDNFLNKRGIDLYQTRKNEILEFCNTYNKLPNEGLLLNWWNKIKGTIKTYDDVLYEEFSANKYTKANLDKYLNKKLKNM